MKKLFILPLILLIAGCSNEESDSEVDIIDKDKTYNWRLVTSWPKNYPGLGMAPERIADLVEEMSDGQMKITVNEHVKKVHAYGVFNDVNSLTIKHKYTSTPNSIRTTR